MFPAGGAGLGLLILRFCDAGMLLYPMLQSTVSLPSWAAAMLVVIAISLCIGALTPFGCIASCLAQIVMLFADIHENRYEFALSLGVTWALFLLGPGAFSVDGRLFGRRLILPSRSE
jgi:hypothetical protein